MSAIIADSKIRQVRVADLRPHEKNARKITTEMFLKLRRSIAANPELLKARPVLALPDGRIIGGRFRWEAVKAEGWETVPTFAHDWDEDEALEIMLRDNNPYGEDDDDLVAEILWGLHERGRDLDLVGLPTGDVKSILASVGPVEGDEREDELPRVPGRPKSKAGHVYELGRHRIMVGDSTNPDHVAKLLDGASADLLVTSPPYNVDVEYDGHDDKAEWPEYSAFLQATLDAWLPHVAPGRAVCWNVGTSPQTYHARQLILLEEAGLTYVRQFVWRKVGVAIPQWFRTVKKLRARYLKSNYLHEVVLVFSTGELELGPEIDVIDDLLEHDVFMIHQSMSTRDVPAGNTRAGTGKNLDRRAWKAHPAVFPVRLPQAFITHLTAADEVVVDPYAGSGSTILAAEKMGRVCYAMEKSPAYVDVARERWKALHGG